MVETTEDLQILQTEVEDVLLPYFSTTELDLEGRRFVVNKPLSYPEAGPVEFNGEEYEIANEKDFERVVTYILNDLGMLQAEAEENCVVAHI